MVVDSNVRIQIWNRHAYELWGLRGDEVEGEHLMNLDIGLQLEQLHQPIRAILSGEEAASEMSVDAVNRRGRTVECCRLSKQDCLFVDARLRPGLVRHEAGNDQADQRQRKERLLDHVYHPQDLRHAMLDAHCAFGSRSDVATGP